MASTASSATPAPKGKTHAEYMAEIQHLMNEGQKVVEERTKLTEEVAQLQQQVNALSEKESMLQTILSSQHTFKMKMPESFTGNEGNLQEFLTSARAYITFNSKNFTTEESKVLFIGSLFKGTALSWFEPFMRDHLTNARRNRDKDTKEIFDDYDVFEEKLKTVFGWPDEERINERKLRALRQQGSASEYTAKFRQISSKLEWADEPLMAQYYEGLKDDVKDELIRNERPDDLAAYIEQAVRIDNRLQERRLERRGHHERWTPHKATFENHGFTDITLMLCLWKSMRLRKTSIHDEISTNRKSNATTAAN